MEDNKETNVDTTTNPTTTPEAQKAPEDSYKQPTETQQPSIEVVSNGQVLPNPNENAKAGEAEKETNSEAQQTTPEVEELQKGVDDRKQASDDAKKVLSEHKINFDDLQNEYDSNGQLSEETYTKLEKAGFPKTLVNNYVKGLEALADQYTNAVYGFAGGKEDYAKMTEFVKSQGKTQVDAFNRIIEIGDVALCKSYIEGVKAQMVSKYGTSNPTILGNSSAPAQSGFKDAKEMMSAMNDKRYGYDEQYTKAVQAKVQLSKNIFG